jgi:serine/threonine protein kinase/CheY-like chemotaxis protein
MVSVLVIEDEIRIRQNIVDMLSYEGITAVQAENGLAGVQLARQYLPDLIICDVMMPGLDGYSVLRELQSEPATALIPFVFLTALSDRPQVRYGMELGADDYLTKPFDPDELIGAIRTRLAKHAFAMSHHQQLNRRTLEMPVVTSFDQPKDTQSLVGTTLRGYHIWEIIGEGGAGTVYKAYQPAIGREVAIKVLRQKYVANTEFVHRFQTEAELVARLEHPHIIPLYDYWYDDTGVYIVMRWVRGGSLRLSLEQGDTWDIQQTAHLLDQVSDALSVAHSIGIIHRDLKPDNILLDEHGNAYLTDFGLAKNLLSGNVDPPPEAERNILLETQDAFFKEQMTTTLYMTDAEHMAGTPAYLSPEQIRFEPLSPQTDIYSLGITLYEMLAGQHPFMGTIGEVVMNHLQEMLPAIHKQHPGIPIAIDEVIQKATAKDWRQRYEDARALAADFHKASGKLQ